MEQLELLDIPKPCRGVCQSDSRGYCLGCMRNRQERFDWQQYSPAQQLYVLKLCRRRFIKRKQQAAAAKMAQQGQTVAEKNTEITTQPEQDISQFDLPL